MSLCSTGIISGGVFHTLAVLCLLCPPSPPRGVYKQYILRHLVFVPICSHIFHIYFCLSVWMNCRKQGWQPMTSYMHRPGMHGMLKGRGSRAAMEVLREKAVWYLGQQIKSYCVLLQHVFFWAPYFTRYVNWEEKVQQCVRQMSKAETKNILYIMS